MGCDATVQEALRAVCTVIEAAQTHLGNLDAAIGDGDHGVSMGKSFRQAGGTIDPMEHDVGATLINFGTALLTAVGGAMGPLFGSAFVEAGRAVESKERITAVDLAAMLKAAESRVASLGGASPGDKTMLDALHPATRAAIEAARAKRPLRDAVEMVAAAAEMGARDTEPLLARVGRASRLGNRVVGHRDPGAESVALILRSIADYLEEGCDDEDRSRV